ncbi:MAG: hypothetical protein ISEC1_P0009 [Thiomicrorhabdus sp.]|nr:MAG: hypothetical protein ISEC1_P0009 [Thiomicrorhabdus sp.]
MNLFAESLTLPFISFGWLLFLSSLVWAFKTAPWHKVEGDRGAQNILLATALILFFLWQLSASLGNGLTFHFLLGTLLTLMFGVQFAFIAMVLALIGVTFESGLGWLSLGINAVLMGLVPIIITSLMLRFSRAYLELNFFVYVIFNAFLASAIGVVVSLSLGAWVMWVTEAHSLAMLKQSFIPYIPLMATPEGFLNGLLMTAVLFLKPNWVSSFNGESFITRR